MAGTYPAVQVDVAWGVASSAVPSAGQWVDESAYVSSVDIKHGSEDEFSEPGAGTLEVTFDNKTGRFDPDNTAGPRYGQLLPLTWVRVKLGTTTANTDAFYGQVSIEGWRLAASQFTGRMVVNVTVVDMFEQLANTDLPVSVYALEVKADSPRSWWRLGESSGTVASDSSGNGFPLTYEEGATFNSRGGLIEGDSDNSIEFTGSQGVVGSAAGITSAAYSVEFWINMPSVGGPLHTDDTSDDIYRQTFTGGAVTVEVAHRSQPNPGGILFTNNGVQVYTTTRVDDEATHHVVAVREAGNNLRVYIDGVDRTVATAAASGTPVVGSVALARNNRSPVGTNALIGTLDEVAVYNSELSSARIAAHYNAGTTPWKSELTSARVTHLLDAIAFPATLRTVGAGQSTMQSATLNTDALSALQDVAKTERGDLYVDHADGGKVRFRGRHARWTETRSVTSQATFGDSGSEVTYSAIDVQDDRIVNRASVQRANGATITVSDASSETQYQRRTLSDTGLLFETDAESQARAELVVAEKKDRHRRVRSITLEPAKSTHSAWAQVFARQEWDRITVKWRPPYGGTYSFDSWIIGIAHSWRPGDARPWRTVFHLEPVPYNATAEPYFIVGTSTVSGAARLGY